MTTYVFLGPSLPVAEAVTLCPRAVFLPPAAVGDVYRLVRDGGAARLAIVDGYFERMAAVWHKEILFALERRCEVWGAASMGALRAAELASFGMVGVGRVYHGFARGALCDDDEVAVAHLPAEQGFTPVSTAMVELRAGLALAFRRGLVSARARDVQIARAKATFYRERGWALAPRLAPLMARERRRVDVKAADARALLRRLAATPERRPPAPRWRMARTWFWERFTEVA